MKTKFCIEVKSNDYKISVDAFWNNDNNPYAISSGYIVTINDNLKLECLDDDHVYRELKSRGYKKSTINFLIKNI